MYTVPWTRIPENGTAREEGLALDLESLELGAPFVPGSLSLSWELSRRLGQAYGSVEARARLRLNCGRCLEDFESDVAVRARVLFEPRGHGKASHEGGRGGARQGEGGDLEEDPGSDLVVFDGDGVPLGEEARQELEMAVPFGPLCRPDCRGLCPRCGANLNAGPCACAPE